MEKNVFYCSLFVFYLVYYMKEYRHQTITRRNFLNKKMGVRIEKKEKSLELKVFLGATLFLSSNQKRNCPPPLFCKKNKSAKTQCSPTALERQLISTRIIAFRSKSSKKTKCDIKHALIVLNRDFSIYYLQLQSIIFLFKNSIYKWWETTFYSININISIKKKKNVSPNKNQRKIKFHHF